MDRDDEDGQSFVSAAESLGGASDEEDEDGDFDDLEYLTLDLVNVLPVESWQSLLDVLKSREGKAMDLSKENDDLKAEVRSLRSALRCKQESKSSDDLQLGRMESVALSSEDALLRADLERRVTAFATDRRGAAKQVDELSEDLREAAAETLAFLQDASLAAGDLTKLLAMLAQWLVWATRQDLAPRGASGLLGKVPEETLQFAFRRALKLQEECAGGPEPTTFTELPHCVPIALGAIDELRTSPQAQRVGVACIALGTFSEQGKQALLDSGASGIKSLFASSARRPRHPELQSWTLAAIYNISQLLISASTGADIAFESSILCATAIRNFSNAPEVLERAAHTLTALLQAHPRRVGAAARTKHVESMLEDAVSRFPPGHGNDMLLRRLSEALAALRMPLANP